MYSRVSSRRFRRLAPLKVGRSGDVESIMRDDDLAAAEYLRWAGDDEEICENCSTGCCSSNPQSQPGKDLPPIHPLQVICCSRVGRLCIFLMIILAFYLFYLALIQSDPSRSVNGFGEVPSPKISFNASRPIEILSTLCAAYSRHEVSGDACMRLCFKDKWEVTEFYEGNKVVIVVKDGGQQAVFKSSHPFIDDFRPVASDENEDAFTDHVLDRVNDLLRLGWPSHYKRHLVETVWPSLLRTPGQPLTKADRTSLAALLQQEEYITFRVIPLSRVTPKVIGTCGHFYQTETLVAFRMKGYYMNLKGKILVHLMGTLKLFYEFLNEPLQWCDARFDNLGLSADYPKRFVIMDGDLLYTESRLNALFHQKPCASDEDCVIGDCKARCTADMVCGNRMNENLDVFCEKLVNPMFGSSWSKGNKYLAACHDSTTNFTKKLNELRLTWSWSLSEV
ncbi:unnamed protein product, partial [Mesorhabditis belari]|uniref:FAM69 protein-kinase domain-containing protein n=1 Tax=Mesorhabditis belari TaxID=2138241 RepID=A0AAF3EFX3_9BILA